MSDPVVQSRDCHLSRRLDGTDDAERGPVPGGGRRWHWRQEGRPPESGESTSDLPIIFTAMLTGGSILPSQLVQTVLDQAHLAPLPISVRPVLWDYDHALRLYPMPTTVRQADPRRRRSSRAKSSSLTESLYFQLVLADSFEPYKLVYERCLVFNPGSFHRKRFGWSTYHPHMVEIRDRMEERCAPARVVSLFHLRPVCPEHAADGEVR